MIDLLLSRSAFQLRYLNELLADIPDDRMADQPAPGINHPAWILGHLAFAQDRIADLVGGSHALDPSWEARFGPRSRPSPERSAYPSKSALMEALAQAHDRSAKALAGVEFATLSRPFPNNAFRDIMPTVADGVVHLLTSHEAGHAGQLSAWRRAAGIGASKFMSLTTTAEV